MKEINANRFAVEILTGFAVLPLETVSTQTKHVFTRSQGWDGGAPMKTDPTCNTKDTLHAQHSLMLMFRALMNVEFLT